MNQGKLSRVVNKDEICQEFMLNRKIEDNEKIYHEEKVGSFKEDEELKITNQATPKSNACIHEKRNTFFYQDASLTTNFLSKNISPPFIRKTVSQANIINFLENEEKCNNNMKNKNEILNKNNEIKNIEKRSKSNNLNSFASPKNSSKFKSPIHKKIISQLDIDLSKSPKINTRLSTKKQSSLKQASKISEKNVYEKLKQRKNLKTGKKNLTKCLMNNGLKERLSTVQTPELFDSTRNSVVLKKSLSPLNSKQVRFADNLHEYFPYVCYSHENIESDESEMLDEEASVCIDWIDIKPNSKQRDIYSDFVEEFKVKMHENKQEICSMIGKKKRSNKRFGKNTGGIDEGLSKISNLTPTDVTNYSNEVE